MAAVYRCTDIWGLELVMRHFFIASAMRGTSALIQRNGVALNKERLRSLFALLLSEPEEQRCRVFGRINITMSRVLYADEENATDLMSWTCL